MKLDIPTPSDHHGKKAHFGVRPEDLRIAATGDTVLFSGTVDIVEALGEVTLLHLDELAGDEPVVVKLPGIVRDVKGSTLAFTAENAKLHLFNADGHSYRVA